MDDEETVDGGVDDRPPDAPARRPRHRLRWVLAGLVVVLVVWGGFLASRSWSAYQSDKRGLAALEQVKGNLTPGTVTSAQTVQTLRVAQGDFRQASDDLSSPLFGPVTVLPVIGRQLRSVRAITSGAVVVSGTGATFVDQVQAVLDQPRGAGPQRVASLRQLGRLSGTAATALDRIDTGPSNALVGPLASKRSEFVSQLDTVRTRLASAAAVSSAVADILQGPQTYLVLASNNAEMRAGSGAFLEVGTATTADGSLHLGTLTPSGQLTLPEGEVTATGDLQRNWGWLKPGVDWRNLGVTPEFDVTAPLAARMWQANTGQSVNGVLALDVEGLRQLLVATGPVTVGTTTVTADTIEQYLLHDQYEGLADDATDDAGRTEQLGALSAAVIDALQGQSIDLKTLATSVATATAGRHLLVWSAAPTAEAAWRTSGVAGMLTTTSLDADLLNRGGNKLDPYLSVGVTVTTAPSGADTAVTMAVHLANHTPSGQSQFIAGPYPGLGSAYGEYVGVLAANLPAAATRRTTSGGGAAVADGAEGPTWLSAVPVTLAAGTATTVSFHFVLPGHHAALTVVPSARIPGEQWTFGSQHFTDTSPRGLSW
jgi:hypothetical protein